MKHNNPWKQHPTASMIIKTGITKNDDQMKVKRVEETILNETSILVRVTIVGFLCQQWISTAMNVWMQELFRKINKSKTKVNW